MSAYRRFAGEQLAAATADHIALRKIDLRREGIDCLPHWVFAVRLLDAGREAVASASRGNAACSVPFPDLILLDPVEIAEKILVRLIDAHITRLAIDELYAPVRVVAKADHVRRLDPGRTVGILDSW